MCYGYVLTATDRFFPARLWPNDSLYLQRLLPIPAFSSSVQFHRCFHDLLPSILGNRNLILQEASHRCRDSSSRISLGGVIFPIMVSRLVVEVIFGWTMRICAFLILRLLIFANLFIKSRIPPYPKPVKLMVFITPLTEPTFALLAVVWTFHIVLSSIG
jgi:hypothetical protein